MNGDLWSTPAAQVVQDQNLPTGVRRAPGRRSRVELLVGVCRRPPRARLGAWRSCASPRAAARQIDMANATRTAQAAAIAIKASMADGSGWYCQRPCPASRALPASAYTDLIGRPSCDRVSLRSPWRNPGVKTCPHSYGRCMWKVAQCAAGQLTAVRARATVRESACRRTNPDGGARNPQTGQRPRPIGVVAAGTQQEQMWIRKHRAGAR